MDIRYPASVFVRGLGVLGKDFVLGDCAGWKAFGRVKRPAVAIQRLWKTRFGAASVRRTMDRHRL